MCIRDSDPKALEARIIELIEDYRNGYISNQKGIYEYLFDGQERHLNIRAFSPEMARAAYERQKGICPKCGKHFEIEEMQADHITPWSKGGKTTAEKMCIRDRLDGLVLQSTDREGVHVLEVIRHEGGGCRVVFGLNGDQQIGGAGVRHRADHRQGVVVVTDGICLMAYVVLNQGIVPLKVEVLSLIHI